MERIITSIKGPVLALGDKYLPRSRKIQRIRRCVSSRNYLTVCNRTGVLDFYDYCETDNWLIIG